MKILFLSLLAMNLTTSLSLASVVTLQNGSRVLIKAGQEDVNVVCEGSTVPKCICGIKTGWQSPRVQLTFTATSTLLVEYDSFYFSGSGNSAAVDAARSKCNETLKNEPQCK